MPDQTLSTYPRLDALFVGRDNAIEIEIRENDSPKDLSVFNRFVLKGDHVDVDTSREGQEQAIRSDKPGVITLACGRFIKKPGKFHTTLIAYGDDYEEGVRLWSRESHQAYFRLHALSV